MRAISSHKRSSSEETDLLPEYRFDYSRARTNRFANRMKQGSIAVVLDPDVASVFQSSESVNDLLRSVLLALPIKTKTRQV